jgi:VWFA-related protein
MSLIKFTVFVGAILAFFCCFSTAQAQDNKQDEVITITTSLVNIPVIVSDRQGRYISGLSAQNFTVYQDGEPQKIEFFANEEVPINVAILLDTSRSTQDVLGKIKKSAKEFLQFLRPQDHCLVISFDNDVEVLSELTNDRKKLEKAIKNAEVGERVGTALRDAIYDVVKKHFASVKGRKAIILLTDGKDAGSFVTRNELLYDLEETDTMIYPVFYETDNFQRRLPNRRFPDDFPFPNRRRRPNRFPDDFPRRFPERAQQRNEQAKTFLHKIADLTAGRLYETEVDDLDKAFENIAEELRKQYLIGFYPEKDDQGGKLHQIKVKVDRQEVSVRYKTTYRSKE